MTLSYITNPQVQKNYREAIKRSRNLGFYEATVPQILEIINHCEKIDRDLPGSEEFY